MILAADSRRTLLPAGNYTDDFQKVKRVSDTCWVTAAGNVSLCNYLTDLIAEFCPHDLTAFLKVLQPVAQAAIAVQASIYYQLQQDYSPMAAILVGGYDPASGKLRLIGFSSADGFIPSDRQSAIVGGTPEDQQIMGRAVQDTPTKSSLLDTIKNTIRTISEKNPQIGPHGHIVSISRGGSRLEEF